MKRANTAASAEALRSELFKTLDIPSERCPLEPEYRGTVQHGSILVEKWIWTSEGGSRVPSLLYRPRDLPDKPIPGITITNGHGGSKNSIYTRYAGQLYASMGLACLVHDTIGEEERHSRGEMGTRDHDDPEADRRAAAAGRLMMGKMVFDAMRSIDFLLTRDYIDAQRIGCAGNSLGGTVSGWLLALETRLKLSIVSGGGYAKLDYVQRKPCTAAPNLRMRELCDFAEFLSLSAPHCSVLVMNGIKDSVITKDTEGYWEELQDNINGALKLSRERGTPGDIRVWFEPNGGHRAYHLHKHALERVSEVLGTPNCPKQQIAIMPEITLGEWMDRHGIAGPRKYGNRNVWDELHHRGAVILDAKLQPIPAEYLKCLEPEEIGRPAYTIEGWLDMIEGRNGHK